MSLFAKNRKSPDMEERDEEEDEEEEAELEPAPAPNRSVPSLTQFTSGRRRTWCSIMLDDEYPRMMMNSTANESSSSTINIIAAGTSDTSLYDSSRIASHNQSLEQWSSGGDYDRKIDQPQSSSYFEREQRQKKQKTENNSNLDDDDDDDDDDQCSSDDEDEWNDLRDSIRTHSDRPRHHRRHHTRPSLPKLSDYREEEDFLEQSYSSSTSSDHSEVEFLEQAVNSGEEIATYQSIIDTPTTPTKRTGILTQGNYGGLIMPQKLPVTGLRQSPIDISTNGLQRAKRSTAAADLPTLSVDYSTLTGADGLTVENTGHGWKLNIPDELAQRCPISGGPLGGNRYRLLQVHAHWGHDSSVGSEHTIDGVSYPCEIHLVHWNATKYGNAAEAMEYHADGLAVIGVFVRTASESAALNDALQTIVAALPRIPFKGDRAPLDASIDLNSFIVDRDAPKYWHYEGSLTTPPYSESVMWIVMRDPIDAKDSQLESFRRMNKNDSTADQAVPLKANYRKVQELNNRPISTFD